MKSKDQFKFLEDSVAKLQSSTEFRGLAVIILAIALEKQVKNVIIFNYRKSGLSASFIRSHLLKGVSYTELLNEFDWACQFKSSKKIKQVWKDCKPSVSNLFGVMEIRNRLIHSNGRVSSQAIDSSVHELLFVIQKLAEIFEDNFGYNGLEPLPKTIGANEIDVNPKLFHKAILKKFKV
jgi:hypothetical protein